MQLLRKNVNLFSWVPADIPETDTYVVCHQVSITFRVKPVTGESENKAKNKKLLEARFIQEIKYLTWLANIVVVKKNPGK